MNRILAAIDFSEVTAEVISKAVALQKAVRGQLCILHVEDSAPYFYSPKDKSESDSEAIEVSAPPDKSNLESIRSQLSKEQVEAEYRLVEGPAVDNILSEAKAFGADIIVVGVHHGKFYHLLFGDTTESLIRRALCPILVVPHKEKK